MRNRSYVFDGVDFKTCSLQCADSSFTAGSRTFYENFYLTEAMFHSRFGSLFSSHLCSERSALTGTAETEAAGTCPGQCIAFCISDRNDRVIEIISTCSSSAMIWPAAWACLSKAPAWA